MHPATNATLSQNSIQARPARSTPRPRRARTSYIAAALALACVSAGVSHSAPRVGVKPDALLQIDLNRTAVVERILASWGTEVPSAQIESLKSKLMGLRADQLLAANLSGSFDGVLEVLERQSEPVKRILNTSHAAPRIVEGALAPDIQKALGDLDKDLVYTPITPCNLMDTRPDLMTVPPIAGPALVAGYIIRNIQVTGNCTIPAGAQAVSAQFTIQNIPSSGGVIFAGKSGAAGGSAVVSWSAPVSFASGASAIPISAAGQMQIQSANVTDLKIDVNGYFTAPSGIIGDITSVTAGAGLTGGGTSGSATLSLATTQLLPTTACATNQIAKWNGTAWACAADATPVNAWTQGGNAFGAAGVIGTTDAQNLTVRTGGSRISLVGSAGDGLRVEVTATAGRPNVTNGSSSNVAGGAGFYGATVAGGGILATDCVEPATGTATRDCGNRATHYYATVGGGISNQAIGASSTVAGGANNTASATESTVGGGGRNIASGQATTVSGGDGNTASNFSSAVLGGRFNTASGSFSAVSGGQNNTAGGSKSAVSGGETNTASGLESFVGGGFSNLASGGRTVVSGGNDNTASGGTSMVPGGFGNVASGNFSFAAGNSAKTQTNAAVPVVHHGAFVWADDQLLDFNSFGANTFNARSTGGVRFVTANNAAGAPTAGVQLAAGGGSWTSLSDRNAKTAIAKVDVRDVLRRVVALPISTWQYNTQSPSIRHIGPMSQDFKRLFGVGETETGITSVDADGVALAAIQGLNQLMKEKDAKIDKLERELALIKRKLGL